MSFFEDFRHTFAENGPQDLKMVQKDASSNSTQSMIKNQPRICDKKSAPKLKYEESYGNFPGMSAVMPRELRIRKICVCVTHIQLVSRAVSGPKIEIET